MCGSGCTCGFTPPTCSGTMRLFTDGNCANMEYDVPATTPGTCQSPTMGVHRIYNSYHYDVDPTSPVSCSNGGSSSAQNLALTNEQTICCAP
jgi:hypothetical protein